MKEHPILFSTPMIEAILAGRKTMTRRVVTKNNSKCTSLMTGDGQGWHSFDFRDVVFDGKKTKREYLKVAVPVDGTRHRIFPKWDIGDVLWVREKWKKNDIPMGWPYHYYAANDTFNHPDNEKWKPSIFMPRDACRLRLEITGIRAERLQDISKEDAINEGIGFFELAGKTSYRNYFDIELWFINPVDSFRSLWYTINDEESWLKNPLDWVIEFKSI